MAYLLSRPPLEQGPLLTQMAFDGVIGLIVSVGVIAVASGIQIFGSGLNSESIHLIFGIATILNVLFNVHFGPIGIGIGLINPIFVVFALGTAPGFLLLMGWFLATGLALTALVSGVMAVSG